MRGLKPPPPSESSFSAACVAESIPEPVELPSDLIEAVPEEPAEPALVSEPAPVGESIPELPADQPVPPEPAAAEPVPMPEPTAATESISELVDSPSDLNESIPDPPADQPALPEQSAAAEPAPMPDSTAATEPMTEPPTARAAEPSAVAVSEPAPVVETSPAPAPAPKPPIKLETRDNEADLSPFSVVVDQVYDGPLDLLLDLIRKQDIDIYDIPIAKITAQFLAYVNQLKAGDVDVAGEFIYIASLLIHIKSKMLLPRAPAGPDDAAEDPRRELVERLLEHERFKNAAQMLQQKQMLEAATWTNPGFREFADDEAAEPEIAADTVDLVRIFRDILERARSRPVINVTDDSVTVGQMIQFLGRRLAMEDKPVALRRLLSHTQSERALIAMFLALLELVRMQAVLLRQDRAFSEIFIKKHTGFDAAMNEGLANARDDGQ
jgi:segregation and condensation protein A